MHSSNSIRTRRSVAATATALVLTLLCRNSNADTKVLVRADLHYQQKSYAAALKEYRAALAAHSVPTVRQDEIDYRILVALAKTHRWDSALSESVAFIRAHRGTIWEARGLYQIGRLYLSVPSSGYRVGKVVTRGDNVPKGLKDDKARAVTFGEQDQRDAREALEAARLVYDKFPSPATAKERILLDFDLAHVLAVDPRFAAWQTETKWPAPGDPSLAIHAGDGYSPDWVPPKKVLSLYAHIRRLAGPLGHATALSLLDEALWLHSYQIAMRGQYAFRYEIEKAIPIPYPYDKWDPYDRLRQIVRELPNDPIRDQAQFLLGHLLEQESKFSAAAAEYRRMLVERPKSKWASDCRAKLADLAHKALSFATPPIYYPGQSTKLQISSRNLSKVRLQLYRVPLERWIASSKRLSDPTLSLTDTASLIGSPTKWKGIKGKPDSEWTLPLNDPGDYQTRTTNIRLPLRKSGAYLLVASAPGIQAVNLVIKTDVVLVQKVERDHILCFSADARTGRPVPKTEILAREWYYAPNKKGQSEQHVATVRGVTGPDGTVSLPILRKADRTNFQIASFAWRGSDYALTEQARCGDVDDNQGRFKTYGTTDRAVYRPQQTVQFREVIMERRRVGMLPVIGRQIHIQVFDPKGRRIYASLVRSSEFGSVNGHFTLPDDSPLGEYAVQCSLFKVENAAADTGGSQFRVEEYKKPEFQVTVVPDAERVRLGQPTSVRVQAKYYFGGPAVNAAVTYRVHRNLYAQIYRFPQPFDFLYNNAGQGSYDNSFRNGEVVAQGKARTDDKGEAKITFPTQADDARWKDQDLSYTVEADVKDSSRRTITGSGTVKATHHDVGVFLNYPRGYAHVGDHVQVEIVTLSASDVPVPTEGTVSIFRESVDPKGKELLVYQNPFRTDSHGRSVLDWIADRGGYLRIAYKTQDSAGLSVEGSIHLWVQGTELTRGEFLSQGVILAVEHPYYEEGQTARVLITTETPDCAVLLTREVNNQILEKRIVRITGRSMEVSFPLVHRDVPNVYISAAMVRNGKLFQATQELFVPPVSRLAKLSVHADKERYQPGEKAKLSLLATDWQNRPLRTEMAVSISDAALAYIQKDFAQDIRVYFYGDRRSQSIGSSGSTGAQFQEFELDTQRRVNYVTHRWIFPDGVGMLNGSEDSGWKVFLSARTVDYEGGAGELTLELSGARGANSDSWHGGHRSFYPYGMTAVLKNRRVEVMHNVGDYLRGGITRGTLSQKFETDPVIGGINSPLSRDSGVWSRHTRVTESFYTPAGSFAHYPAIPPPTIRRQFLDTAFWTPAVVTDARGTATVEVTWPDNLTQWRAVTVGNSAAAQVGTAETSVTTRKDLLVRLETPRYFVERDTMTISAIVQNSTEADAHVLVKLDLDSDKLEVTSEPTSLPSNESNRKSKIENRKSMWVDVPKYGEGRVDWKVQVRHPGVVRLVASAQAESASDAAEATVPILVHGIERALAASGVMRGGDGIATVPVTLPDARKAGTSEVVVQVNPSLAAVMLDALPYLNEYPYGCIEQTMSRFLPSILTARILKEQGFKLEDLRKRAEVLRQQAKSGRGDLKVEDSPYTYPAGKPAVEPAIYNRLGNAVFDSRTLDKMVSAGMARIRDYQHSDGGWGWWKDDPSDTWMTAYVLYGLSQAKAAGTPFDSSRVRRAEKFLLKRFREDDDLHEMTFVARVLALSPEHRAEIRKTVAGRLYDKRERLSAYSKALLSLALSSLGENAKAAVLLGNLENTAQIDESEGTAHWGDSGSNWWCWYNDQVETNAAVLQAYLAAQPGSRLAPMIVKWLVNHREGDNWSSTRETALTVYALSDYILAKKELAPSYDLTLEMGDRIKRTYHVTPENALFFDNRFVVPDSLLQTGSNAVSITKKGAGTCYYNVYTRFFSQEESIPASGNGIYATRKYFRLIPGTASGAPLQPTVDINRPNPFLTGNYELLAEMGTDVDEDDTDAGPRYERAAIKEGDTITSGDLIEVELNLDAKNDYSYLAFEDLKPAGCEPVEVRSGEKSGQGVYSNFELRDQKVVFFISTLPQGTRSISYRLRAEAPGAFHVLPTNGYAMYAPTLRTLSAERTLNIKDD